MNYERMWESLRDGLTETVEEAEAEMDEGKVYRVLKAKWTLYIEAYKAVLLVMDRLEDLESTRD